MRDSSLLVLASAVVGIATFIACIPDPKGDYEEFRDKTAGLNPGTEVSDAGPIDAKPPEQAVEETYGAICVTALANRDPEQALRFYTESKYVPDGPGAPTGKLTLNLTAMKGWEVNPPPGKYVAPTTFSKSETRGNPISVSATPVNEKGRFTANLGTANLTAEANSISGREAVIENVTLDGIFGTSAFCSTLGGNLTVPYAYDFKPAENTCVFFKLKEGDPFPKPKPADFVCPF
jgi:hypothetical protein